MNDAPRRKGLGRGLAALLDEVTPRADDASATELDIDLLEPNPDQPRKRFEPEELEALAQSVREKGVIQPLIVRADPAKPGRFQIVAGERRWRAAQMAGRPRVPVVVRDFDDSEVLEVAILENVQRADLNPIEEAAGYQQLIERFSHTQEKIAQVVGKSRSHIANCLRLLALPEDVKALTRSGQLSAGHARAVLTTRDPSALARRVVAQGLSVRETEAEARKETESKPRAAKRASGDADTRALEADLAATLGMPVRIAHAADGSGSLTIRYRTLDDLDRLCGLVGRAET
jgi:ParB family chromosome partitioning protein